MSPRWWRGGAGLYMGVQRGSPLLSLNARHGVSPFTAPRASHTHEPSFIPLNLSPYSPLHFLFHALPPPPLPRPDTPPPFIPSPDYTRGP